MCAVCFCCVAMLQLTQLGRHAMVNPDVCGRRYDICRLAPVSAHSREVKVKHGEVCRSGKLFQQARYGAGVVIVGAKVDLPQAGPGQQRLRELHPLCVATLASAVEQLEPLEVQERRQVRREGRAAAEGRHTSELQATQIRTRCHGSCTSLDTFVYG
eukprot:jgi/Ulvmu1/12231/UM086_0021.1